MSLETVLTKRVVFRPIRFKNEISSKNRTSSVISERVNRRRIVFIAIIKRPLVDTIIILLNVFRKVPGRIGFFWKYVPLKYNDYNSHIIPENFSFIQAVESVANSFFRESPCQNLTAVSLLPQPTAVSYCAS